MALILSSKSKKRGRTANAEQDLITTSIKRFKITAEAESESRRQGLEDLRFSIGTGQWDEAVKANREIEGKPCLTINRAPAFLRQYTGEERQHRPAMLVSPVGSGADLEVGKIHQGALRHIEVVSTADLTYDNSYDMMMRIGWCPWRITTEYISERSFEQEPRIEPIENPFAVYLSPVRRPDGTDPLWAHVIRDYAKDEYVAEFGETELAKLHFPSEAGNAEPEWVTKDGVRIAEYWWIDLTVKRLCLLDDGSTAFRDELDKPVRDERSGKFRPNARRSAIVGERDTIVRKVHCVKHDAMHVLKRYEYVGKYIPLPEVNGVRLNINGTVYRAGMVRDYRDAQRIYDFMVTRQVEQVDLYSKDPAWVPEENAQFGEDYRLMNRKNFSHLYYKTYTADGKPLPAPMRIGREANIGAMTEIIKQADYDMKAVIGVYGPSLGEESGSAQESGFAILTRQDQSDAGSINWHDNLNRAIAWQGKILLDLWPKLISSARIQRIINPDDSVKHAVIFNSQHAEPEEAHALLNEQAGLKKAYDVGVGDYDIVLSSGPTNKTARREAFKALTMVINENPQMMLPVVGDIWAKNADFPDADVLAARFKKMLPANLQDDDADDKDAKLAQKDAQLAATSQQLQVVTLEYNKAADTIRTKRLEIESKERIAYLGFQHDLVMQELKSADAGAQAHLQATLATIQSRLDLIHSSMSVEQEAGEPSPTPETPHQIEPPIQPVMSLNASQ